MTSGLKEVLANLNKEVKAIEGRTREGLFEAGLLVQGHAMEFTPVKKGLLVNSAFTAMEISSRGARVSVGYTKKYALYVHEMPASNNFTKIDTGPKFLQRALFENTQEILDTIRDAAMIPGG